MAMFNKKPRAVNLRHLAELEPMLTSGRPVLVDFYQTGCAPCQVMDGIMNELAREYGESAHIVKVDVTQVEGAAQKFQVRSTPTFVLLGGTTPAKSRRKTRGTAAAVAPRMVTPRWRSTGLIKKDQLQRMLESNGASR